MPESAIAAPPSAAPAAPAAPSPNAAPAAPAARTPSAPPSKPAAPPSKPAAADPGKIVNPFDQANADLAKFADPDEDEPRPPGAPKAEPKPKAEKPLKDGKAATDPDSDDEEGGKPADEANPDDPKLGTDGKPVVEKPGKASPWKLVEAYKGRAIKAELRIAELEAAHKPGEIPADIKEKFSTLEARNKELEDEIRHVNYSKSNEFVETYQKPYEQAWASAIADLKELVITNDDGSSRQATAHDLIALANMPLGQARIEAKKMFGDSADDVMAHRRVIRDLSEKQNKALDEAKTKGGEREQQRTAEMTAKQKARAEATAKVWHAVNEEAVQKYEYLRPVEGETERNAKLEKAQKFVDETMKKSLSQAKTDEERDQILRSHAAVRNRAIGFSVMKHENVTLRAKVAELEKALAEFQGSEPTGGALKNGGGGEGGGDEMSNAMSRMAKYVT